VLPCNSPSEGDNMKIFNEWTVGGSLLLIGAGFFSTRFSDVLAYRLGSVPSQVPVLGGKQVTVGRVLGLVPLTMGLGVLLGKMRTTPVVDRVVELPVVSNVAGFVQDLGNDMKVVIGPGTAMAAETDGYAIQEDFEKRFTSKRVPKRKISTDTSKPKGSHKSWKTTKRAESWTDAVSMARKDLGITGFEPIRKGSALYTRAKELYSKE